MSEQCEHCGTWEEVRWWKDYGDICEPCFYRKIADEKAAEEQKKKDLSDFFHL